MSPQYWTPSIGGTYQNRKAEAAAQKYGAAASAFYLLRPPRVPTQFRSTLFCPHRRSFLPAVFVPVGPPGFPENGRSFC